MKLLRSLICCALVCGAGISYALAEDAACDTNAETGSSRRESDGSDAWKDKEIREMVTTVMMVRMSRELDLSDEQTVLMVRNFSELRDKLTDLGEKRGELIDTLRDKVDNHASDSEIEPLLDQLMSIDDRREAARREAFEKAGADLTVSQRAKLYIFTQDFEWHMRRLIMKAREIGGDRVKRWHDAVVNGDGTPPRGPRDGDRERDHPEDPPKPKPSPEKPAEGSG